MYGSRIIVAAGEGQLLENLRASLDGLPAVLVPAGSGAEALHCAEDQPPDLIVCDLCLPDLTGLALVRMLREREALRSVPVLMITPYNHEADRILAFETGVDDLLGRPFFPRELASRARAILRRAHMQSSEASSQPSLPRSSAEESLDASGEDLTPRERQILRVLRASGGRVLTRREIALRVWGSEEAQSTRVVDAHVKGIRRKLDSARHRVETVRGIGYRYRPID